MNVSDTLNKAADLIEEKGWGQGPIAWDGCESNLCLEEAIGRALGFTGVNTPPRSGGIWPDDLLETPAARAVSDYLRLPANGAFSHLYAWNDNDQRTAAEVIEVLRATALIEAAREAELAVTSCAE